jgi:hypothetical protein
MRKNTIVGTLLVWFTTMGCQALAGDTRGLKDAASMKALLQRNLPVGTSAKKARLFMEREGFKCSLMRNKSFSEEGVVREGIDYLYCERSDSAGFLVSRRWQVAIVLKMDSVSEVLVSVGLIGP